MNVPPGWESLGPEAKRELLAQLLRQKTEARVFPLSYGQEALWFLYQMAPDSVSYNVAFTARLHSPVDVAALERAFARVVARHEMLRVTFEALGEEPAQRIHDEVPVRIEEIDGRAWTTTDLMRSMAALYQRPFDLQKGPPFRLTLVRGKGAGRPSSCWSSITSSSTGRRWGCSSRTGSPCIPRNCRGRHPRSPR